MSTAHAPWTSPLLVPTFLFSSLLEKAVFSFHGVDFWIFFRCIDDLVVRQCIVSLYECMIVV